VDRVAATTLVVAAGAAVAAQGPFNGAMARHVGIWPAALVSFVVGGLILIVVCTFAGGFGGLGSITSAPWWAFLGGATGVAIVSAVMVGIGPLGAAGVTAATIGGQLAASVVIDRYGLFGMRASPLTAGKIIGIVLLAVGVWLIVRDR
jgi:transporter family-2 protein